VKKRIDFVLSLVDMLDWKKSAVKGLSGGMKRRVEIARGLVHFPRVLFLDEPTAGLDAQTRANIWEYIRKLQKQKNITIFMTTHYMEEAEICDHLAIIDHGKIAAYGTIYDLKRRYSSSVVRIMTADAPVLRDYLVERSVEFKEDGGLITFHSNKTGLMLDIVSRFRAAITDLEISKGTLNDVYLSITGKEVRS
jgi:ABC-2 type transport system ATP-binding protein